MRRFTICLYEPQYLFVSRQLMGKNEFLRLLVEERMRDEHFREMVSEITKARRDKDETVDDLPY